MERETVKEEKVFEISMLLDFYGEILTETQREALDLFYNDDLSLGEIADQTGITRQGVRDRIVKGEKILTDLEAKLGLVARFLNTRREIEGIVSSLTELRKKTGADVTPIIEKAKALL